MAMYKYLALTVISKKYIHKPIKSQLNYVNAHETKTLPFHMDVETSQSH
jgi:hypothetical protein